MINCREDLVKVIEEKYEQFLIECMQLKDSEGKAIAVSFDFIRKIVEQLYARSYVYTKGLDEGLESAHG